MWFDVNLYKIKIVWYGENLTSFNDLFDLNFDIFLKIHLFWGILCPVAYYENGLVSYFQVCNSRY